MRTRKLYPAKLKPPKPKWIIPAGSGLLAQIQNNATYVKLTKEKMDEFMKDWLCSSNTRRPIDWTVQTHKPSYSDAAMAFGMSLLAQKQLKDNEL